MNDMLCIGNGGIENDACIGGGGIMDDACIG
jgi:hypothetical protein